MNAKKLSVLFLAAVMALCLSAVAVFAAEETLNLEDDLQLTAKRIVAAGDTLTVNLNGKTVTTAGSIGAFEADGGTINIVGPGTIIGGDDAVRAVGGGVVTLTNATVKGIDGCAIFAKGASTVNATGCDLSNESDYGVVQTNGSTDQAGTTINLTNCNIHSATADVLCYLPGYDATSTFTNCTIEGTLATGCTGIEVRGGSLTVTGGSITVVGPAESLANGNGSTTTGAAIAVAQHNTNDDIQVNVSGATLEASNNGSAFFQTDVNGNAPELVEVEITDSTLIGEVSAANPAQVSIDASNDMSAAVVDDSLAVAAIGATNYASLQAAFAAALDGDTITLVADCDGDGIIVPQGKFQTQGLTVDYNNHTFDMNGTTVGSTGTETLAFQLLKDNTITFKNGTVTASTNACRMLIQNYSNLTLDNMNVDGTHPTVLYAVSNNNGETLIKDSVITASEGNVAFDVWYGMSASYPSVSVTVENSTVNGDVEFGAHRNANMENVSTNMSLNISDSTTVNGDLVNSSASNTAAAVAAVADDIIEIDATSTLTGDNAFEPFVAKIGDTKYATLQEAFAAAQDGDTITLTANCNGDGIIVPQGKFQPQGLIVDFNGFTFDMDGTTVGSAGTETLAFQLLKDNTITFKNGTVTASTDSCKMLIQNYSNLTLDNMNVDGTHSTILYAVSNNNGETLIKDSVINASEGHVAFDVWYGMNTAYPSVAVTVQNSTVNGTVEYGASTKAATAETIPTNMSLTITDSTIHGDIVNSSAAALADAVEEAAATTLTIEDSVIDGANVFDVSKTLVVYNMEKTEAGDIQIAVFAGVDSLNYERAGFVVTQNGVTTVYTTRWVSTAVNVNGDIYEAAAFGDGAQYVFGDIITVDDDAPVTIQAFVKDFAGNVTYNNEVVLNDPYTLES